MARQDKGAGLRVVNLKEFRRSLAAYGENFTRELLVRARKMGVRTIAAAKRRAPVDKGQMRASLRWMVGRRGHRVFVRVGSAVKHARRVEFPNKYLRKSRSRAGAGTVQSPYTSWPALRRRAGSGQTMPFLRPAVVDVWRQWALAEVKAAVRAARG